MDRQDNKLLLSEELLLSVSQASPLYIYTFNDSILGRRRGSPFYYQAPSTSVQQKPADKIKNPKLKRQK